MRTPTPALIVTTLVIILLISLLVIGCANPVPAKTFGSMLGAQPSCVLFCRVEQTITADSTPPSDSSVTMQMPADGPAVFSK